MARIPAYILYPLPNSVELDDPAQGPVMGRIFFSAVEQETHELDSDITDHAVEKGANITDHVRDTPDSVTINVFNSNEPIEDFPDHSLQATIQGISLTVPDPLPLPGQATVEGIAPAAPAFLPTPLTGVINTASAGLLNVTQQPAGVSAPIPSSANVLQFGNAPQDIPQSILEKLLALKDAKTLVSVITPIGDYSDMVLKTVTIPRDPKTGTGMRMSLVFRHLNIVSSQLVTAPKIPKAAPKESNGTITLPEYTPPAPKKSIMDRLLGKRGGKPFAGTGGGSGNFGGTGATGSF